MSPLNLTTLSQDVLLSIFELLHVSDIVSARQVGYFFAVGDWSTRLGPIQTCQTLAITSKQRLLWMRKLRDICEEDLVFAASFPMDHMSTGELEAAAMGPTRFVSLLIRWGEVQKVGKGNCTPDGKGVAAENGLPCRPRRLLCEIPSRSSIYTPKVFLVPGGRFLIIKSCLALQMWDLGVSVPSKPTSKPTLLDTHTCDFVKGWEYQSVAKPTTWHTTRFVTRRHGET